MHFSLKNINSMQQQTEKGTYQSVTETLESANRYSGMGQQHFDIIKNPTRRMSLSFPPSSLPMRDSL